MGEVAELVGKRIREYRLIKGLSQEELAHLANMHASHVGQIERGEKSPTLDSLEKIVEALGISFEELFRFNLRKASADLDTPFIDKVAAYLKDMTPEEQKDVLKMIKILARWKGPGK